MPAQGLYERPRNFPLPIIIRNGFAEETAAIRRAQRFERIGVESPATDTGEDSRARVGAANTAGQRGSVLSEKRANTVLTSYCRLPFAGAFKLYKIYGRAAAFNPAASP